MACPNNNVKNSNIPEINSYGDRSQVIFAGTRLDSAYIEQINMPYAVGQLYSSPYNNQLMMALYFFEYDISSGGNPCFNLNLIDQQTQQRSFKVFNLDYANRSPQVVYGNYGGTGYYYNNIPSVYFQATDKTRNVSLQEQNFNGQITVLESNFEGALVRFESVNSVQNCYRTPENKSLACGARISGQIRVAFCR
jgi:hypothetical protein